MNLIKTWLLNFTAPYNVFERWDILGCVWIGLVLFMFFVFIIVVWKVIKAKGQTWGYK